MSKTQLNIFVNYKNSQEHCAEGATILTFSLLKTKKLVIPDINDGPALKVQRFLDFLFLKLTQNAYFKLRQRDCAEGAKVLWFFILEVE